MVLSRMKKSQSVIERLFRSHGLEPHEVVESRECFKDRFFFVK